MLVLCSDGLSSHALVSRLAASVRDKAKAALVVTADNIYKEKNYHVPRCIRELQSFGLSVDMIDLDVDSAEILSQYDVVEFIGGNPYYLLNAVRTTNCAEILRNIAQTKVLIGWSAAVFVFGPTLALADRYTPEMNEIGLTDLSGIALTDCVVLPHYSKFSKKFDHFEEKCQDFEATYQVHVIRLNDGDGLFLQGEDIELCRA